MNEIFILDIYTGNSLFAYVYEPSTVIVCSFTEWYNNFDQTVFCYWLLLWQHL